MAADTSQTPLLLDTTVFSLLLRPSDSRTALYLPELQGRLLALSFVSVGELYRWAIQRNWGAAKFVDLQERLKKIVILPFNDAVALQWARIQASTPKSDNDAWIAACALAYGCTLATDDDDFGNIHGLHVITHRDG